MKVYAVINQKGGVGKTTTVANLGAAIAARGRKICLIDLDPQAHLTLHFGVEPDQTTKSVYDVMANQGGIASAVTPIAPGLCLVPATIDLVGAQIELVSAVRREQILRDSLKDSPLPHELVMIDCPPSLGLLTLNALAAADEVLIPLQPHFLALQGLGRLLQTISLVQLRINPALRVAGVIFCMYETGTRLAVEVADDLEKFFTSARGGNTPWSKAKIFQQRIRRNIKLAECPSHAQTIFDYEPTSHGAQDYGALADEFLALAFGPGQTTETVRVNSDSYNASSETPAHSSQVSRSVYESSSPPRHAATSETPPRP